MGIKLVLKKEGVEKWVVEKLDLEVNSSLNSDPENERWPSPEPVEIKGFLSPTPDVEVSDSDSSFLELCASPSSLIDFPGHETYVPFAGVLPKYLLPKPLAPDAVAASTDAVDLVIDEIEESSVEAVVKESSLNVGNAVGGSPVAIPLAEVVVDREGDLVIDVGEEEDFNQDQNFFEPSAATPWVADRGLSPLVRSWSVENIFEPVYAMPRDADNVSRSLRNSRLERLFGASSPPDDNDSVREWCRYIPDKLFRDQFQRSGAAIDERVERRKSRMEIKRRRLERKIAHKIIQKKREADKRRRAKIRSIRANYRKGAARSKAFVEYKKKFSRLTAAFGWGWTEKPWSSGFVIPKRISTSSSLSASPPDGGLFIHEP